MNAAGHWLSRYAALCQHAEQRAKQWQQDADAAMEQGNFAWAEECHIKAKYWKEKLIDYRLSATERPKASKQLRKMGSNKNAQF